MSATSRARHSTRSDGPPMRTITYWTPRYIYHRIRQMLYKRDHGDDPWLTRLAIRLLKSLLRAPRIAGRNSALGSMRATIQAAARDLVS